MEKINKGWKRKGSGLKEKRERVGKEKRVGWKSKGSGLEEKNEGNKRKK